MTEPTDAEVDAYLSARRTPVLVAHGRLQPKGTEMEAINALLCIVQLQGLPRLILEDEVAHAIIELTEARVVLARMESRLFDSTAVVEVQTQGDDGQRFDENGQPAYIVLVGPKHVLKGAFAAINVPLR